MEALMWMLLVFSLFVRTFSFIQIPTLIGRNQLRLTKSHEQIDVKDNVTSISPFSAASTANLLSEALRLRQEVELLQRQNSSNSSKFNDFIALSKKPIGSENRTTSAIYNTSFSSQKTDASDAASILNDKKQKLQSKAGVVYSMMSDVHLNSFAKQNANIRAKFNETYKFLDNLSWLSKNFALKFSELLTSSSNYEDDNIEYLVKSLIIEEVSSNCY